MCQLHATGSGTPQIYRLKYDRIHLIGRPKPGAAGINFTTPPFLQLSSPYYNSGTTRASVNQTMPQAEACSAAVPNTLDFAGSQSFSLDMWTYQKDSGMDVDLGWCVAAFFLLSFFFQVGACTRFSLAFLNENRHFSYILLQLENREFAHSFFQQSRLEKHGV